MKALASYLGSTNPRLLGYLDENQDLSLGSVEQLYRYAVALLQGHIRPEHVKEDWEDFFYLGGAFVFAYGSERLSMSARRSTVLWVGRPPGPIDDWDRALLIDLVRELGTYVALHTSTTGGGTQAR